MKPLFELSDASKQTTTSRMDDTTMMSSSDLEMQKQRRNSLQQQPALALIPPSLQAAFQHHHHHPGATQEQSRVQILNPPPAHHHHHHHHKSPGSLMNVTKGPSFRVKKDGSVFSSPSSTSEQADLESNNVVVNKNNNNGTTANNDDDDDDTDSLLAVDDDDKNGSNSSTATSHSWSRSFWAGTHGVALFTALIVLLGAATGATFLATGLQGEFRAQQDQFERHATEMVDKLIGVWDDYIDGAALVHHYCRDRSFTRPQFRNLYEYLVEGTGLDFKAVQFDPNISLAERPAAEAEARAFYEQYYPHINYTGFMGVPTATDPTPKPRPDAPFYFPIHFMEPIVGNEAAIDLDYYSSSSRQTTVDFALTSGLPAITDRLVLVKQPGTVNRCISTDSPAYGVVLMHPGVNVTQHEDQWPRDLSSIVICVPNLLMRAVEGQRYSSELYIHDNGKVATEEALKAKYNVKEYGAIQNSGLYKHDDHAIDGEEPIFIGGIRVVKDETDENDHLYAVDPAGSTVITHQPDYSVAELQQSSRLYYSQDVIITNRRYTLSVVAVEGTYQPYIVFVVLGAVIIFVASLFLASGVYTHARRVHQYNQMKAQNEAEKAHLIIENAQQATKAERDLNDFIAHEVRNPISTAMSALSFVRAAVDQDPAVPDLETTRADVGIIENALGFVNDLLRNMLDMHRVEKKQLTMNKTATDVMHDILEPVEAILFQRGNTKVRVELSAPPNLIVMTDGLRLKQVMLNLARNSSKFVEEGFIRLQAFEFDNGHVGLAVEDSGPGMPKEKQDLLFSKWQESLDVLSQGTGIGLFLCKNLVELLDGRIYLDSDYNSGIDGRPGCRFVVELNEPALVIEHHPTAGPLDDAMMHDTSFRSHSFREQQAADLLPEHIQVLFVDDDLVLRKLFQRSIKKVAPGWTVREASNGETALKLAQESLLAQDTENGAGIAHKGGFDLIFMDMYMASVTKQMLGTETIVAMRNSGIDCCICGLSANNKEEEFFESGADAFLIKPFPCEDNALKKELARVLSTRH